MFVFDHQYKKLVCVKLIGPVIFYHFECSVDRETQGMKKIVASLQVLIISARPQANPLKLLNTCGESLFCS